MCTQPGGWLNKHVIFTRQNTEQEKIKAPFGQTGDDLYTMSFWKEQCIPHEPLGDNMATCTYLLAYAHNFSGSIHANWGAGNLEKKA